MDKFTTWYRSHNLEITWFIIGWLVFASIDALLRENYIFAVVDAGLAYLNYRLYRNDV